LRGEGESEQYYERASGDGHASARPHLHRRALLSVELCGEASRGVAALSLLQLRRRAVAGGREQRVQRGLGVAAIRSQRRRTRAARKAHRQQQLHRLGRRVVGCRGRSGWTLARRQQRQRIV
jgi:hypothetical protein